MCDVTDEGTSQSPDPGMKDARTHGVAAYQKKNPPISFDGNKLGCRERQTRRKAGTQSQGSHWDSLAAYTAIWLPGPSSSSRAANLFFSLSLDAAAPILKYANGNRRSFSAMKRSELPGCSCIFVTRSAGVGSNIDAGWQGSWHAPCFVMGHSAVRPDIPLISSCRQTS